MLDLVIRNARIADGTGAPSFVGDLGVQDGLIRSVGKGTGQTASRPPSTSIRPGSSGSSPTIAA
jgi:N-acyl-D-aspartate/D-glutamate deacylase